MTKFSRRELQLMYRGFKQVRQILSTVLYHLPCLSEQECPTGFVKEETFKNIYAQFFPRGADTTQYAHYVFNTFDPNRTGVITFTVSVLRDDL